MFHLYLTAITLLVSSCASKTIQDPFNNFDNNMNYRNESYRKILQNNNKEKLKVLLKQRSFLRNNFKLIPNKREEQSNQTAAYRRLTTAITGIDTNSRHSIFNKSTCRTEIVKIIIEAGLTPRPKDLADASMQVCPQMVQLIIEKLSKKDINLGVRKFSILFANSLKRNNLYKPTSKTWDEIYFNLLNVSNSENQNILKALFSTRNKVILEPIQERKNYIKNIERKYKINFCKSDNLFEAIYFKQSIKENCIYALSGPLVVLQNTSGGVLIHLNSMVHNIPNQIFFLKTKIRFVDNQRINPMFVKKNGVKTYKTVIGTTKTVYSFKLLETIKKKYINR